MANVRALPAVHRVRLLLRAEPATPLAVERRNLARFAALLALLAIAAYIVVTGLAGGYRSSDWPNQMILARLLTTDPAHVYDHAAQVAAQLQILGQGGFHGRAGGLLRLSSPPWLGLLTLVIAPAGVTWGGILWSLLQLACLLLGFVLLARDRTDALYVAAGVPAWVLVANANAAGLVVLGLGLSWRLRDRHPWLAGLALGLALVRPNILLPLPFAFVLWRQWRVLGGAALATAILVGAVEIIHPGLTFSWIAAVFGQAGHIGADLSPAGIGWILGQHLGWAFAAAGLAVGLWLTRGRGPGLLPAAVLASPHALVQSLVLAGGGLAAARRCGWRELGLLNAGAVVLLLVQHTPLLEAILGTALLLGFVLTLREPAAARAVARQAEVDVPAELAPVGAAA